MAKICWATDYDPLRRYENLAAFCQAHGLGAEQRFFTKALKRLHERQLN
jgi:hypothetical protein